MATRALVLGSGGWTGVAWEAGVLQGLAEAGYPVVGWDLVVGSSAGAFVGAHLLTEGSPRPLFEAQLAVDVAAEEAALAAATGKLLVRTIRAARRPGFGWLERLGVLPLALRAALVNAARDGLGELAVVPAVARSRRPGVPPEVFVSSMCRLARGVRTSQRVWIDYWARALAPIVSWPEARLVVTAIDISDGSLREIDRTAGVPLARAVAASTAVGGILPPISIGERRHIDGGTRSQTNVDLATGFEQVLVLAPADRGTLATELEVLAAAGCEVRVIRPSETSKVALGEDLGLLDPARRAASARAGREDGLASG